MSNRRKSKTDQPDPNPQCMPVPRDEAVSAIAAHIADRTAFVISAPPEMTESAAHCLSGIGEGDCYMDNGLSLVFRLSGEYVALAEVMAGLLPGTAAAVFTVPKTVSAARLSKALQGQPVPEDGSQDLVMLHADKGLVRFPTLLVEALALVEPDVAMQLAANDVRRLS